MRGFVLTCMRLGKKLFIQQNLAICSELEKCYTHNFSIFKKIAPFTWAQGLKF
jgi:uncharacterized Fe-S cluster protein YjdI